MGWGESKPARIIEFTVILKEYTIVRSKGHCIWSAVSVAVKALAMNMGIRKLKLLLLLLHKINRFDSFLVFRHTSYIVKI